ncbi:MAG: hypothetical protein H6825_09355 [Planctomycetes bacterium]|nr:hypothetical protein [Planctomycetota bacterium]
MLAALALAACLACDVVDASDGLPSRAQLERPLIEVHSASLARVDASAADAAWVLAADGLHRPRTRATHPTRPASLRTSDGCWLIEFPYPGSHVDRVAVLLDRDGRVLDACTTDSDWMVALRDGGSEPELLFDDSPGTLALDPDDWRVGRLRMSVHVGTTSWTGVELDLPLDACDPLDAARADAILAYLASRPAQVARTPP